MQPPPLNVIPHAPSPAPLRWCGSALHPPTSQPSRRRQTAHAGITRCRARRLPCMDAPPPAHIHTPPKPLTPRHAHSPRPDAQLRPQTRRTHEQRRWHRNAPAAEASQDASGGCRRGAGSSRHGKARSCLQPRGEQQVGYCTTPQPQQSDPWARPGARLGSAGRCRTELRRQGSWSNSIDAGRSRRPAAQHCARRGATTAAGAAKGATKQLGSTQGQPEHRQAARAAAWPAWACATERRKHMGTHACCPCKGRGSLISTANKQTAIKGAKNGQTRICKAVKIDGKLKRQQRECIG